jgi:hypothetical protein
MLSTLFILGSGAVIGHFATKWYRERQKEGEEPTNGRKSIIGKSQHVLFQSGFGSFRPPPRKPTPDVTDFEMVEQHRPLHEEPSLSMMIEGHENRDHYDGIYQWK